MDLFYPGKVPKTIVSQMKLKLDPSPINLRKTGSPISLPAPKQNERSLFMNQKESKGSSAIGREESLFPDQIFDLVRIRQGLFETVPNLSDLAGLFRRGSGGSVQGFGEALSGFFSEWKKTPVRHPVRSSGFVPHFRRPNRSSKPFWMCLPGFRK